jgi:hypothetical protein
MEYNNERCLLCGSCRDVITDTGLEVRQSCKGEGRKGDSYKGICEEKTVGAVENGS